MYIFFQALILYVSEEKNFSLDRHELVTNFPRHYLLDLDHTATLQDLGLHPQETVFIQERDL